MNQFGRRAEDPKPQTLRAGAQPRFGQSDPFQPREHVVGDQREPYPRRISSEPAARHHPTPQLLLQHVVPPFNRARLFTLPFEQFLGSPTPLVAGHRKILRLAAIAKQLALPPANADRHVPEWSDSFWTLLFLGPIIQN